MPASVYHPLKLNKDVRIALRGGAYVVADAFRPRCRRTLSRDNHDGSLLQGHKTRPVKG
jgi:hypothetical protein